MLYNIFLPLFCIYVYKGIYVRLCVLSKVSVCNYFRSVCIYARLGVFLCASWCGFVFICVCLYVCVSVCMFLFMFVCLYVFI